MQVRAALVACLLSFMSAFTATTTTESDLSEAVRKLHSSSLAFSSAIPLFLELSERQEGIQNQIIAEEEAIESELLLRLYSRTDLADHPNMSSTHFDLLRQQMDEMRIEGFIEEAGRTSAATREAVKAFRSIILDKPDFLNSVSQSLALAVEAWESVDRAEEMHTVAFQASKRAADRLGKMELVSEDHKAEEYRCPPSGLSASNGKTFVC